MRSRVLVVAVVALVGLGGFLGRPELSNARESYGVSIARPAALTAIRLDCGWCMQQACESEHHRFAQNDTGPDRAYSENHSVQCLEGWCADAHPESPYCNTSEEELSEYESLLIAAVEAGSAREFDAAIAASDGKLVFNRSRRSIQVRACADAGDDAFIANIPLGEDLLVRLTRAEH